MLALRQARSGGIDAASAVTRYLCSRLIPYAVKLLLQQEAQALLYNATPVAMQTEEGDFDDHTPTSHIDHGIEDNSNLRYENMPKGVWEVTRMP